MTKYLKISIISPSYNQAEYIENTIISVISQKYPNLEYLVIDGGSTDGTIDILQKYESHITWISEPDTGQSNAINKGIKMSSGDIIAVINTDDTYEPGAFRKINKYFNDNPNTHWVTGKCRIINAYGTEIRKLITAYKNFWLAMKSYKVLLVLDYISQPATFWSKDLIANIGPFNEGNHYSMDYEYSLRTGSEYKLHYINDYLANFRVHSSSKSSNIRKLFNSDLSTANAYTHSIIFRALHRLHNEMIITIYNLLKTK